MTPSPAAGPAVVMKKGLFVGWFAGFALLWNLMARHQPSASVAVLVVLLLPLTVVLATEANAETPTTEAVNSKEAQIVDRWEPHSQ
jgi:hypothetical protein